MDSSSKYLCIHGHFYQPPRQNPWTEHIDVQPSAAPFSNWNARIAQECYGPNSEAVILNDDEKISYITNNYKYISYNFGPTLLRWLHRHQPRIYAQILQADQESPMLRPALAQVYHHLIMPLANTQDKETQILWGIRDFEFRFNRYPEGMWLAETAVDLDTLEHLATHNIKFTILAPHQARAFRTLGEHSWHQVDDAPHGIDTSVPYLCTLPSGKTITLFFYNGELSRAVAFDNLLDNGESFAHRLTQREGFTHIATDGESYGHHHRFGEMALAYALHTIKENNLSNIVTYASFLDAFPPQHEVQIHENTSWSCAHGIERWRSNCGCHTGGSDSGEYDQSWRAPLRQALDWLRDACNEVTSDWIAARVQNPWQARNDFVYVLHGELSLTELFDRLQLIQDTPQTRTEVEWWLKIQENLMKMYTSCGWFFHDLAGIETIQILLYAGRAMQLFDMQFQTSLREEFVSILSEAHAADGRSGDVLFAEEVYPFMLTQADTSCTSSSQHLLNHLEHILQTDDLTTQLQQDAVVLITYLKRQPDAALLNWRTCQRALLEHMRQREADNLSDEMIFLYKSLDISVL